MKEITMVILAAGKGNRFSPFVTDKPLFPFFGKPLIDFALPKTYPPSIARCVVVANPENKDIFSSMQFPVPSDVVVQEGASGMAGAIRAAKDHIHGKSILIVIADDVADETLLSKVLKAAKPDVFGVITTWKPKKYFPGGYVMFREDRPIGIREKPGEGNTPSDFVYFGGQFIRNADALLEAIDSIGDTSDDIYEQALSTLMAKERFSVVVHENEFVSLKYPWHVLDMTAYMLKHHLVAGKGKNVDIRNNVSLEGAVYLGNNVKIFENTKIIGPVYIGDNTIVGNNNIIRESIIGENCVTGFNTDITRSYIGDDCWFHSNYIGDSVLEGNVSMGSGSVLANLRLDEKEIHSSVSGTKMNTGRTKVGSLIAKDVRVGVNVSIMPGIKVGSNSFIGAGITLDKDVSSESFCVGTTSYTIKKNTARIAKDRDQYKAKI